MSFLKNTINLARSFSSLTISRIPQILHVTKQASVNSLTARTQPSPVISHIPASFSTSCTRCGLEEFFDEEDNWPEATVKVGRPWKLDELRIKSNSDLHKLWYVLLKERNMLLTMEDYYTREAELMPSPERIFKVEESMENILSVVKERNVAFNLLETGETGLPETVMTRNFLGLKYKRRTREYNIPRRMNRIFNLMHPGFDRYFMRYVQRYKEQMKNQQYKAHMKRKKYNKRLLEKFPHLKDDERFKDEKFKFRGFNS